MIENDEQALAVLDDAIHTFTEMDLIVRVHDARQARNYLRRRLAAPASHDAQESKREVGCEGEDGLLRIHPESATCDVCKPEAAGALAGEDVDTLNVIGPAELAAFINASPFREQIISALSAAPAPAQQPAVVGDDECQVHREAHLRIDSIVMGAGTFEVIHDGGLQAAWGNTIAAVAKLTALTPAATPVPDGGGQAEPVAWGMPNTRPCAGEPSLMMVRLQIPSDDQYGGALWVPLYTHPPEQSRAVAGVPDGWKLVPLFPTGAMRRAFYDNRVGDSAYYGDPTQADLVRFVLDAWMAMLDAAPTPPAADADGGAE